MDPVTIIQNLEQKKTQANALYKAGKLAEARDVSGLG
jgi:hypothetical protein